MIGTLEEMCHFLDESLERPEDLHLLAPLKETLTDFRTLRGMLEDCIDFSRAKQDGYAINPKFDEGLRELDQ